MQTTFERFGKTVELIIPETFPVTSDPVIQYLVDYGWKQSLSDSYAAAKNAEEFEGKLKARYDAILAGTVKSPGTGTAKGPRLSPLEREMLRIATDYIDKVLANRPGPKVPKEHRTAFIEMYLDRERESIRIEAEANIADLAAKVAESGNVLDALYAEVVAKSGEQTDIPAKKNKK